MSSGRKRVNLTVDADLYEKAHAKHYVISRVLDDALRELVSEDESHPEEESINSPILERVDDLSNQIEKIENERKILLNMIQNKNSTSPLKP